MEDKPGRRRPKERAPRKASKHTATPETERQEPHQVCVHDKRSDEPLQIDGREPALPDGDILYDSEWTDYRDWVVRMVLVGDGDTQGRRLWIRQQVEDDAIALADQETTVVD